MKKWIKIFWPAILIITSLVINLVIVNLFHLRSNPITPVIGGINLVECLYFIATVSLVAICPLAAIIQFIYSITFILKTNNKIYLYHLLSSLIVGLCFYIMHNMLHISNFIIVD